MSDRGTADRGGEAVLSSVGGGCEAGEALPLGYRASIRDAAGAASGRQGAEGASEGDAGRFERRGQPGAGSAGPRESGSWTMGRFRGGVLLAKLHGVLDAAAAFELGQRLRSGLRAESVKVALVDGSEALDVELGSLRGLFEALATARSAAQLAAPRLFFVRPRRLGVPRFAWSAVLVAHHPVVVVDAAEEAIRGLFDVAAAAGFARHARLAAGERSRARLVELLEESRGRLALPQAAKALALSERSLQRLLGEQGTSFSQCRQRVRVEGAKALLGRGRSVTEVALELGYRSANSFIKEFRKATGDTPGQWRVRDGSVESREAAGR